MSTYYYEKPEPVVVTVSNKNHKITQELPWDCNSEDLLQAIYTAAVGITFNPQDFLRAMRDFANDNLIEEPLCSEEKTETNE
jgi:hypothetical protein